MRLIKDNRGQGEVTLEITDLDDLWYLHELIEPGDTVKGRTTRKIKAAEDQEGIRKTVIMAITVTQAQFAEGSASLRVLGTVTEAPEDIPQGTHHTFSLEPGSHFTLKKPEWLGFQAERLREACTERKQAMILCVFDREEAYFARLKRAGFEQLSHIKGEVARKRLEGKGAGKDFFEEIIAQLKEYDKRFEPEKIIVASPSFWKDELLKRLSDAALRKKIIMATCSGADTSAFNEVMGRDEVKAALAQDRVAREMAIVERLLSAIAKNSKAAYGLKQVAKAADSGAIETLIITDRLIRERRAAGEFAQIEAILREADRSRGKVVIVSSEHDGGRKIDGLGGMGAMLRYEIE